MEDKEMFATAAARAVAELPGALGQFAEATIKFGQNDAIRRVVARAMLSMPVLHPNVAKAASLLGQYVGMTHASTGDSASGVLESLKALTFNGVTHIWAVLDWGWSGDLLAEGITIEKEDNPDATVES